MSTLPQAKQRLIVTGELAIDGSAGYNQATAFINFNTKSGSRYLDLAQIRCFGGFGYYTLLLDGSGSNGGVVVRANANQGDPNYLATAKNDQYSFEVASNTGETTIKRLLVQLKNTQFQNTFDGNPVLMVGKPNCTLATETLRNNITTFKLDSWRIGETMDIEMGAGYSGSCLWGYTTPTSTNTSSIDNYSSFSMKRSGNVVENIRMFTDGSVNIPVKLTANCINATTYENLPPLPASDLLPITLDKTNSRVGINTTNPPDETLQVGGDCHVDNLLRCAAVSANDCDFKTASISQFLLTPKIDLDGVFMISGTGVPPFLGQPVGSLYLRDDGDVNIYTMTTNGWQPVTAFDPLPITLDKANKRVGINNVSPTTALDVTGTVNVSAKTDGARLLTFNTDRPWYFVNSGTAGASALTLKNDTGKSFSIQSSVADPSVLFYDVTGIPHTDFRGVVQVKPTAAGTGGEIYAQRVRAGWTTDSVAIGPQAGWGGGTNIKQAAGAIAIGTNSAVTNQGTQAVAIGQGSGNTNQGAQAVAIGFAAGNANQHANSIILNATGSVFNSDGTSRFFVKPIRSLVDPSLPRLSYNATTGEICYGDSTTTSLLPITLDKVNTRVGINKTVPLKTLDVVGDGEITGNLKVASLNNLTWDSNGNVGLGTAIDPGFQFTVGSMKADLFDSDVWQFNADTMYTTGDNSPEGATPGGMGSVWHRSNPTNANEVMYVKTTNSGITGWKPVILDPTLNPTPAPAISFVTIGGDRRITQAESNAIISLKSFTLQPGTYILNLYSLLRTSTTTLAEIWMSTSGTYYDTNRNLTEGLPMASLNRPTANNYYLEGSSVKTVAATTTFYINSKIIGTNYDTQSATWDGSVTGIRYTKIA